MFFGIWQWQNATLRKWARESLFIKFINNKLGWDRELLASFWDTDQFFLTHSAATIVGWIWPVKRKIAICDNSTSFRLLEYLTEIDNWSKLHQSQSMLLGVCFQNLLKLQNRFHIIRMPDLSMWCVAILGHPVYGTLFLHTANGRCSRPCGGIVTCVVTCHQSGRRRCRIGKENDFSAVEQSRSACMPNPKNDAFYFARVVHAPNEHLVDSSRGIWSPVCCVKVNRVYCDLIDFCLAVI